MTQIEELAKDHRDHNTDGIRENMRQIRSLKITIVLLFLFVVALIFTIMYVYHDIHYFTSCSFEHVSVIKAQNNL